MNIEIKKLSPELTEDYVRFFDVTPHSEKPDADEYKCYCVWWCSEDHDVKNIDYLLSKEKRRNYAIQKIKENKIQGYLAYHEGKPIKVGKTLQKFVTRYEKTSPEVPDAVKEYLSLTEEEKRKARHRNSLPADALRIFMETVGLDITASITDADHVSWIGFEYGVVRIDLSEKDERDRVQYFNGPRYLYDDNNRVEFLLSDNRKGIWVLTESGVSHIELKPLSYTEKAVRMSAVSQEYVNRRGVVSESRLSEGRWVPTVTDNDGLWTSMYAAGECFRYAVETDPARKEIARRIAVASTEAVLLIANISSRDGFTDAKIRHYINTFPKKRSQKSSPE
jgi:hypothetical protein